jgi:hypothetical protein
VGWGGFGVRSAARMGLSASPSGGGSNTTAAVPVCEPGYEQLWPMSVQHETHLFLFAVAVTHIAYSTVTLILVKALVGGVGGHAHSKGHPYSLV